MHGPSKYFWHPAAEVQCATRDKRPPSIVIRHVTPCDATQCGPDETNHMDDVHHVNFNLTLPTAGWEPRYRVEVAD
jgi:hypothetical protein